MAALTPQKLKELQMFCETIKSQPQLLHMKELEFFKKFLEEFGATIPSPPSSKGSESHHGHGDEGHSHSHSHAHGHGDEGHSHSHAHAHDDEEEEEEEMEEEKDEDMEDIIEDAVEEPQPEDLELITHDTDVPLENGDESKEVSDEMFETANNKKMEGMEALREKKFQDSINAFTEAIKNNPHSGILYASRAQALLEDKKPNAAIRDTEIAIRIAPDSAKGYKIRGRARRVLGQYENALRDIQKGQQLDWDESTNKLEAELKPRVEIIHINKKRKEEVEKKRFEAQKKKAQKHNEKFRKSQQGGGVPEGFKMPSGGMPGGGMGGIPGMGPEFLSSIMNDPEVMALMQDPTTMAKLQEIMTDPSKASQYANDPAVQKLMSKFSGMKM